MTTADLNQLTISGHARREPELREERRNHGVRTKGPNWPDHLVRLKMKPR
jgi:hypothetical protein